MRIAYELFKCYSCHKPSFGQIWHKDWEGKRYYCTKHFWAMSRYLDQVNQPYLIKPPAENGQTTGGVPSIIQQSLF